MKGKVSTPSKKRFPIWLAVIALAAGLPLAAWMGLQAYILATATPLHPNAQDVPSVSHTAPVPAWARAVEQARQIVRMGVTEQNLPGISVAVAVGRDIVWAEGFGWADLEQRVPVAPDTRFRIGTASTMLTSAGAALLLEQGRLKLDEKIQTYVPEFPEKPWPVTLRQLMGHVAGVRNDGGDEGPLYSARCERPVDALPHFKDRSLIFEPGSQFRYSSYGWILVSAAIEAAADESFLAFMRTHVFEPLGMKNTKPDAAPDSIPDRATAYFPRFSADPRYGPDPMRPIDYSCYAGSSVFVSTSSDMLRFAMGITSGTLLQPGSVKMLQTSQRLASGQETGYGLGWDVQTAVLSGKQTTVIGHDGDSLGGMVTSLMALPEHGIVVSVMSNTSYADTFGIGVKIASVFATAR